MYITIYYNVIIIIYLLRYFNNTDTFFLLWTLIFMFLTFSIVGTLRYSSPLSVYCEIYTDNAPELRDNIVIIERRTSKDYNCKYR